MPTGWRDTSISGDLLYDLIRDSDEVIPPLMRGEGDWRGKAPRPNGLPIGGIRDDGYGLQAIAQPLSDFPYIAITALDRMV